MSRNLWPALIGATLLLDLLTLLLLGSINSDEAGHEHALQALERFTHAEAMLQRDILLVRAGLLRNYDPLVAELDSISANLTAFQVQARADGLDPAPMQLLQDVAGRQADLTERFKSEQALLRNSLAYFPIVTMQAVALDADHSLAAPIGALNEAVLRLTLDTSPEAVQAVQSRLDALAQLQMPPGSQSNTLRMLERHGRMLERLLPEINRLVHDIVRHPAAMRQAEQELRSRELKLRQRQRTFRSGLYAVSLLVLIGLIPLGLHLRASRLALREQAAIKHMVAQISTGLISCAPERMGTYLTEALGIIGREIGLDRVYVIRPEPPGLHLWTRQPGPLPPSWPTAATEVARQAPCVDGILHIASTHRLCAGAARQRLEAAQVRSWAGIMLSHDTKSLGLLGFDAVQRRTVWPRNGVGSLHSIGQVIEEALWSEHVAAEREALQSRLRQAQRLETAGTIASGLAHNFNNIVGAVLGHAEIAADRLPPGASAAPHVEEIRRAGERARDLVDHMLRFGRRGGAREVVSMSALVRESISLLRVSLPPDVNMSVETDATEALVVGEPTQLQQVIVNLLRNAVQAVGESGQVRLLLSIAPVTEPRALPIGAVNPGIYVRFSISDTGHGMDAATLGRIFEPFFTTRPAGTGLGLATVADILRDHGGALDVASMPGAGTLFEVWLPHSATAPVRDPPRRGQGEIVLVIDGDRARLLKIEDMVAALGYEPAGFSDKSAAIESLSRTPQRFDVALLDATRPDQLTAAVAERISAINPELPLLLIGDAALATRLDGSSTQVVEIVTPPPTSASLATALARCLGQALDTAGS
jgi:signal transduction histidine kinase/CheY-like chemotaxis protein